TGGYAACLSTGAVGRHFGGLGSARLPADGRAPLPLASRRLTPPVQSLGELARLAASARTRRCVPLPDGRAAGGGWRCSVGVCRAAGSGATQQGGRSLGIPAARAPRNGPAAGGRAGLPG